VPLVSDRSLCLGRFEYSETSQVLILFSRDHGVVRVLAKGAHRRTKAGASRFDGGVDLLDLGDALFTDDARSELATLAEWKLIDGHLELRRTLRGLRLAQYAAELVSLLIEARDPHPDLFDRLAKTLPELATPRREEVMLAWELDLLKESGYLPELFVCTVCGTAPAERERTYFSPSRSGLVCGKCAAGFPDRIPIDGRLLRLAQSILRLPRADGAVQRLPKLTRQQTDPLNRILSEHISYTLGRPLKTWNYLRGGPAVRNP
jgi:DNA repair protein RecO (recombination protein O)